MQLHLTQAMHNPMHIREQHNIYSRGLQVGRLQDFMSQVGKAQKDTAQHPDVELF